MFDFFKFLPRHIAITIIKIYQKTLSFDHGLLKIYSRYGRCRYRPTCSEYSIESLEKYGFLRGGAKAIYRILRCNPWSRGGWDPVDQNSKQ